MSTPEGGSEATAEQRLSERERRVAALRANLSDRQKAVFAKLRSREVAAVTAIPRRAESRPAPLSFAQERLWFLDRLEPGSATYGMPTVLRLVGTLDVAVLERCLTEIVRRHETLRTTFTDATGEPRQVAAPPAPWRLPAVDLDSLPQEIREGEALRIANESIRLPFDLVRGPVLSTLLVRLSGGEAMLVVSMHHIVADGWSVGVLVREAGALYAAFSQGGASPLPELPIQYADYAVWQRDWLRGETLEAQVRFWTRELEGAPAVLDLPSDRPRPAVRTSRGSAVSFNWPEGLVGQLRELAAGEGATMFMVLLAAFQAWLHRYSGQPDIPVGTPMANRGRPETEGLIGLFVNTLVLRGRIDPPGASALTFRGLLERTRASSLAAFAHQDLPFERLVEALGVERSLAHTPLFQVMLVHQNVPPGTHALPGLTLSNVDLPSPATQLDLSFAFAETGDGIWGGAEYSSDLFDAGTVRRLVGHFRTFLEAAMLDPDRRISELPLLTPAEQDELRSRSIGAAREVRLDRCLHQGFEEQAARHPEALAVLTHDGDALTYSQLDRLADRLAARLRREGAGPDVPVGVHLPRSAELVIAMLAVLKSGGAYLPLDPGYPEERLAYILGDSGAPVVITVRHLADRLAGASARIVLIEGGAEQLPATRVPVDPGSLAYVIYTSGSTGRPKGTGIAHGPAAAHMEVAAEVFGLGPGERMLQFASPGFDASLEEMLPPLLSGAAVVPGGAEIWPPDLFLDRLARLGVTTLDIPTAYWQQWVRECEGLERLPDGLRLRFVALGGEAMSAEAARLWFRTPLASIPLVNTYGPTEAVVTATALAVSPAAAAEAGGSVPIGQPLAGRTAWVLDRHGSPLPDGVPGELCLGGGLLARGYLGRPDLTAGRFVPDPFGPSGGRLYRSGDLVRRLPDGGLEFLGRVDQQIKIRGFRIELGEIEAVLARLPGVREAVVLAREDGRGRSLAGYLAGGEGLDAGELRAALARELPEYMIPSAFAVLAALPTTPNGKVDRRALARIEPEAAVTEGFVAPRGPVEEMVAGIWADLLGLERVGSNQGFFELGGHSLLAMRVASRLRQAFGVDLPLRRLFEAPTVAALAREIEAARAAGAPHLQAPPLRLAAREGRIPLSFGQERLWFLDRLEPGSPAYNMPGAVRLTGRLDAPALAASLNGIVRRHEALRTVFTSDAEGIFQEILPELRVPLPVVDLLALPPERRDEEARRTVEEQGRRPFDLARGPLIRSLLLRTAEDEHVFALALHHIVADGWSVGVLVTELAALYGGQALPELPVQYADFALWQRGWLSGPVLAGELAWWRDRLRDAPTFLALPADRPRPPVQRFRGGMQGDRLPARIEQEVQALARREGGTSFMVLLAVLDSLLARYTRQTDLVVGTPLAGRDSAETEGLIGLFLNTLVLRVDAAGAPDFRALLGRVREVTLESFAHGRLPFEKLVEELAPERDLSHAPLFQVLFVLQNTPEERIALSDVTLTPVVVSTATSKFDLVLNAGESGDGLSLFWMFNRDLFDSTRIARLRGHFVVLLETALADPGARLSDLPLLSAAERQQLLEWNATGNDWAPEPCLPELIAAQVERAPDAVALVFEGETLTYAELWDRAGALAQRLGVGLDDLVGICAERSVEMVVGLLAILRAGAAYVPIDPGYPADRVAFMLEDSGVAVLLTQRHLSLPSHGARVVSLDDAGASVPPPARWGAVPDSLAYMIYTSGSTGRPKGAMNSHRAVRNRLLWMQEAYGLTPDDRVLQKTPFSFDVSVWEFFWPLMVGARLVVARPGGHQDPAYLAETIVREGITTLHFVPSMLRVFLDSPGAERCTGIKRVICSGEALPADLERRFKEVLPAELHNLYGPTEAAVDVTAWACTGEGLSVPIGRPIANTSIHILDGSFREVPVGVPGELLIGGVQPARGYHRRPELTAERFIPDPSGHGARLYRTGDLTRWRPDGAIEYLGRIDFQVKIRGFRIELGEIETALASHPSVRDVVVVARERTPGDWRLVAYVVGDEAPLQEHLAERVPEYMIPSAFVFLPSLPLSPNGKVDRKALPEPDALPVSTQERVEPRTPLERFLAGLWSETLGVESVGIHDSFFELGGNSITGAVLINRLQRELGEIVHVVVIFDAPTVARMAAYLAREHRETVARRWGAESLGETSEATHEIGWVDAAVLAELRALIQPLPAIPQEPKNPPAVFVLSPPRSGSTLLRVMLGGHPLLFSPPELELLSFNTMSEREAAFPGRDRFWLEGVIRAVMEARGCGPDEAKALVDVAERENWSTQRFYRWLQESLGGRVLVDKTPSYALDPAILRRAEESFENAHYIHLIRHPYGMIRSFEEAKLDQLFFRHPHRFSRRALAELIWLASHQNVAGFLAGIPAGRQHWVRFEDLVRDPERELRAICAFLGIEYHPDMANPYKGSRMTDGIHAEGRMLGDVKFHQHRGVEAGAADRWRDLAAEHALGEVTWEAAVALGYERLAGPGLLPIVPLEPGTPAPLSFAQERLWFLDQLEPGSPLYNIPVALRLTGRLDEAALERSLAEIVRRHAVLRTTFADGPVQIVHEPAFRLSRVDASHASDTELPRLAEEEARRPFDLSRGPLFRATLVRLGPGDHAALVTMHHIVSDGWSIGVLVKEAVALYTSTPLPELPVQYVDFAAWQRERLRGEALEEQLAYWRRELDGAPTVVELPADRPRPAVQSFRGGAVPIAIPARLVERLRAAGRRQGATLFMTLLAAFHTLLHRDSGQEDVLVGSPVAGRTRAELEGLIGFFVNMLVLRGRFEGGPSFSGLLERVRTASLGAFAHQDLPFERLVEALEVERSLSHNPLFQASFALQNAPLGAIEVPGLRLVPVELEGATAKFDLSLVLRETADGLQGEIEHAADLFDSTTVRRLGERFLVLLESIAAEPERPVADLWMLPGAERHQLLAEWAGVAAAETPEPVHRQFERQASRTPGAAAVEHQDRRLTYRELDRLANGVASRLRARGVGPEDRVGLRIERSPEMIAAILGIWKAGGAYVPLDPSLPEARLAYMLEDSGAAVVLTREDIATIEGSAGGAGGDACAAIPSRLSYLIYTSGTTGQPKAVLVEHGSLAHTLRASREVFAFSADDRMPCLAPFSFDIFLFELFGPLLSGGTVVLFDLRPALDVPALVGSLGGMTLLHAVPALMRQVVEQVRALGGCRSLRRVFVGGDAVPPDLLAGLREAFPEARVTVLYGPTEAAILCSWYEADGTEDRNLLGRPLPGAVLRVVDPAGLPAPAGIPGELWIGGPGVARGYLHREELTAERFVERDGLRWYRSGDLARWLADGNLEFLGRIDRQVKIRGFRIELGEIEAVLTEHPGVRQAVVLASGKGEERRLAAYVVPEGERAALPGALRESVARRLPEYMVPSAWVLLDELPVTSHGKIDRRALERVEPDGSGEEAWLAPRTPIEELLAAAWTELLGRERIGLRDDFFELGGHSLLAGRMVSRVRGLFGVELPLRAVFEEPVLEDLAARIDRERGSGLGSAPPIERRHPGVPVPLSFAQERLWFLDRLEPGGGARYGISIALRVRGDLRPEVLEAALNGIVRRHEALRTTFAAGPDGVPRQEVAPELRLSVPVADLSGVGEREAGDLLGQAAARGFDLETGPLLRPLLVRLGANEHLLLLSLHHIVADGWSVGVLVREIAALSSDPSSLSPLPVQYGDYALWQRRWLSGEVLGSQIAWWKEALAGAPTVLELPTDRPRPPVQSFRGASRLLALPGPLVSALRDLGSRQGATLFMTLLAGFDVLLHRYTGQEDVLVGSPVANRQRVELEGLIGLFVNVLVLRGQLGSAPSFRELLDRVRVDALGAYAHQDLPFERLVEELNVERSPARTPLHQVVFALQNNPSQTLELPGLALEPLDVDHGTAKTDLLLSLGDAGEGLAGAWEYSTDLFDAATVERLTDHLLALLEGAAADPEVRIGDLPLLSPAERHQLVEGWNDTRRPADNVCLHRLFEAWVERTPDAVAVTFQGERLTYAELDARAERLARRLRSLGVGPEVLVGIAENESLERVVAVLATFKAGGAYLPLDLTHPEERLAFLIEDAGVSVVLTRSELLYDLPDSEAEIVLLDEPVGEVDVEGAEPGPDNLAYVIYTSGSTGRPNGVLVPHGAASNLILQAIEQFRVEPGSRVLQSVSFSFDASVLETWLALAAGATLCIGSRESRLSGEAMAELIRREEISTAVLTPAGLGMLPVGGVPSLRVVSVGGDRCPAELASRWAPPASGLDRLLNCYGPTEATIYATAALCRGAYRREPPIGKPVGNMRAYVLDPSGEPAPVGVPGELFLAGAGIARGYLGRPALTAERFVPDPFGGDGERLYRTGDLARRLPDGNLDFLGRVDGQVKIRGLRIEVGEVEAAIGSHPAVAECAVLVREDARGERRLAAYVVSREPEPDLRGYLRSRLPDYMVPSGFLLLDSLPLGPTGKVDRAALRRLEPAEDPETGRVEARDVLELELARIWQDVLGVPRVGVRDDFFELGGHSLLAVRLMARVGQRLGRELPLSVLFQGGTVETMAARLREEDPGPAPCLVPIQPQGGEPPLFCVHPAGGDVLCYAALARHLGPDLPFYGLQSRGLDGSEPLSRIEDMAALYLEEIRRVQPEGPYRLGGWSLGGLIAFEMARQLREAGEEVALVAMLDSSPAIVEGGEPEDDSAFLADMAAYVENLWGRPVGLDRSDLAGLAPEEQQLRLLERLRDADFLPPGTGVERVRRTLAVYKANARAARRYDLRPLDARITVFRAEEGSADGSGWRRHSTQPVSVVPVPGHHLNLLAEPNVRTLAARLKEEAR